MLPSNLPMIGKEDWTKKIMQPYISWSDLRTFFGKSYHDGANEYVFRRISFLIELRLLMLLKSKLDSNIKD